MADPIVSVIMAVYNGQEYLRESVESILAQTFADFELVIVDDGSTDRTPDLLRAYTDARIRVIRTSNQGQALARNCALTAARGRYIAVQDADDVALPGRLAAEVSFLDTHPKIAL